MLHLIRDMVLNRTV